MTGYVIYLCGNAISFSSKYHPIQCLSSMESEYMGEVYTSKELLFLFYMLDSLCTSSKNMKLILPLPMFADNEAAIKFAEDRSVNSRSKHIDLRHHYLTSYIDSDVISMNYVDTEDNIADIMTKPLAIIKFTRFCKYIIGTTSTALFNTLFSKHSKLNEIRHRKL